MQYYYEIIALRTYQKFPWLEDKTTNKFDHSTYIKFSALIWYDPWYSTCAYEFKTNFSVTSNELSQLWLMISTNPRQLLLFKVAGNICQPQQRRRRISVIFDFIQFRRCTVRTPSTLLSIKQRRLFCRRKVRMNSVCTIHPIHNFANIHGRSHFRVNVSRLNPNHAYTWSTPSCTYTNVKRMCGAYTFRATTPTFFARRKTKCNELARRQIQGTITYTYQKLWSLCFCSMRVCRLLVFAAGLVTVFF